MDAKAASLSAEAVVTYSQAELTPGAVADEVAGGLDPRLEKAREFIRTNLQRKLSRKDIAHAAGLSPSRLRHLFKSQTNTTPMRYLKEVRMQEAKTQLETTLLTVKEVMTRIGVNDSSNFTHDFKKAFGLTPTQLRNSLKDFPVAPPEGRRQ